MRSIRAALPHLNRNGGGATITVTSDLASEPSPLLVGYAVVKAAIANSSKAISVESVDDHSQRCRLCWPDPDTRTPDFLVGFDEVARLWGMEREQANDRFVNDLQRIPLGRLGRAGGGSDRNRLPCL
jgi:NAD(P)-dependent dehydrogenase (short-subunit alcohol dehydrogenase family)